MYIFLIFEGTFILYFLEWLQKFASHQQCMRILFSPYPHEYLLFLVFLIIAILTCGKRYCDFDLHFSNDSWVWALFMCLVVICRSSLKKISIQILCWFKKLDCLTFCSWVLWVLHMFWVLTPDWIYDLKYFLPFSRLYPLCGLLISLCKSLLFWDSPTYSFLVLLPLLLESDWNIH